MTHSDVKLLYFLSDGGAPKRHVDVRKLFPFYPLPYDFTADV